MTDFNRDTPRFSTGAADTPYQKARQEWDERIGSARVQAHNWRLAFFVTAALALMLAGVVAVLLTRSQIIPYVVEVGEGGRVVNVAPATQIYQPTQAQVRFHLVNFVRMIETLAIDPVVVKQNWLTAYAYVTANGAALLNQHARTLEPFSKIGRERTEADIRFAVARTDDSYEIQWVRRTFDPTGKLLGERNLIGIFTVKFAPPTTEEELLKNPLGVHVDTFAISEGRS